MNRWRQGLLVGMLLAAAAALAQPSPPRDDRTLPLDPLTPAEREAAARIADGDPRVRELVGSRARRIYVEFIAPKNVAPGTNPDVPAGRYAEVVYIRYDNNVGVRALVELANGRVVDATRVSGRGVPINLDEVEEAARIALADGRVAALLGDRAGRFRVARAPAGLQEVNDARIEGLRTLGSTPEDPCTEHRCIVLFFRERNRYIHLNEVVVDLNAQRAIVRRPQP